MSNNKSFLICSSNCKKEAYLDSQNLCKLNLSTAVQMEGTLPVGIVRDNDMSKYAVSTCGNLNSVTVLILVSETKNSTAQDGN